ncbi:MULTISPECIES: putative quinol monooxygenase [unclassified Leifsonia]|uniref:putative quinol monooxygenase n=1 Tax=unclassified Leifsonia TaxID=2663824 RepID=UPI0006FEFC67|nr:MULTISPECIES: putative quinol monooxygenase [unclassified Leifsonia]KQX08138.1 antibiotic biosynthesis monooxygenase [Leifsonia sp. Root1293]KRA12419.1 antibiotic biosynthesis monooxygenase [Leifsonia sp. Root60]
MSVVVTAVFHPRVGQHDTLVAALRERIPAVHAEKGCRLYAIHDAEDGTVTMLEKWDSRADLDAHATGSAVAALDAAVGGFLARPTPVTLMTPIAAGTADQGEL